MSDPTQSKAAERLTQTLTAMPGISPEHAAVRAEQKIASAKTWTRLAVVFLVIGLLLLIGGAGFVVYGVVFHATVFSIALGAVAMLPGAFSCLVSVFCFTQADGEAVRAFVKPIEPILCRLPFLRSAL